MVMTKEILKQEIDHIQDEYIDALYMVIKAFESPRVRTMPPALPSTASQWQSFLDKFAGSCADAPLSQ